MSFFKNQTLLITGGTGSFGNAVLKRFLYTDIGEIRVFSRDEKKQDDMRNELNAMSPELAHKVKFYIGDVRDAESVRRAVYGVDYIFHAAALKQVPACEIFPDEAVKTNVLGTANVLSAAIENEVKKVVCLSTDKAVYPVNAMGLSKALMEKTAISRVKTDGGKTKICCTRYGNVLCSRGSVIPTWISYIMSSKPISVTDFNMTRFIMSLEDAVDLVMFAIEHGENGDILIPKASACTLKTMVEAVSSIFGYDEEIEVTGQRGGEKVHETLLTEEEHVRSIDMGDFYRVPLEFAEGLSCGKVGRYDSNGVKLLSVDELKEKLLSLDYIQKELAEFNGGVHV